VKIWFQAFAFKINLYRYSEAQGGIMAAAVLIERGGADGRGLYKLC
jgi:hypothetical protein